MKASEDYLHGIEVKDDVLLGKLLVVTDDIQKQLIFTHASQDLLINTERRLVGSVLLPFLLDEALDPASQQVEDVLRVGSMDNQLLGCEPAPHSLFKLVYEIY